MYEFTWGGAWLKWSLLDRSSKRLAAGSFVAAAGAAIPIALYAGELGYALGFRLGAALAGRAELRPDLADGASLVAEPWMAWVTLACGLLSAWLWWRFSLRQDELFNRVQNWALGMASGWTMAGVLVWLALAGAGVVPPPPVAAIVAVYVALLFGFWFAAVRRWA